VLVKLFPFILWLTILWKRPLKKSFSFPARTRSIRIVGKCPPATDAKTLKEALKKLILFLYHLLFHRLGHCRGKLEYTSVLCYQFLERSFTVLLEDTDVPCFIGHYSCVYQYKRMKASTRQLLLCSSVYKVAHNSVICCIALCSDLNFMINARHTRCLQHNCLAPTNCTIGFTASTCFGCKPQPSSVRYMC